MMDPLEHLQMLKDRAAGVVPRQQDFRRVRSHQFATPGFDRTTWRAMCGKGWFADPGLPARDLCALAEELGADLAPEPLIEASMAARLLPPGHRAAVKAGDQIVLPAWQEASNTLGPAGETVWQDGSLIGRKLCIPMAAGADAFLVTAGDGLAVVERGAPGVSLELRDTPDGGNLGTLTLDRAPAERIAGNASEALEPTILACSAYLFGLMDRAWAMTREAPGAEQRAEDMRVQIEMTRAALQTAANAVDGDAPLPQRQAAVSRTRLRATDAAIVVTRTCMQLQAGRAGLAARDIELFHRKAMVRAALYGGASAHRARLRAR